MHSFKVQCITNQSFKSLYLIYDNVKQFLECEINLQFYDKIKIFILAECVVKRMMTMHDIQADLGPSLWNGSTCGEKMEMYCSAWDLFRNTPSCKQAIGNSQKLTSLKQNKMHIHALRVITNGLHLHTMKHLESSQS